MQQRQVVKYGMRLIMVICQRMSLLAIQRLWVENLSPVVQYIVQLCQMIQKRISILEALPSSITLPPQMVESLRI